MKEETEMPATWFRLSVHLAVTNRMESSTCIDHIFTNAAEMCLKAVSRCMGCNDHDIAAISRTTKAPKAGPNVV